MNKEAEELYSTFLNTFPIEKLNVLTLDEYTNLERNNSFCYWVETKTEKLGSIWGGSAYKFGIYKCAEESKSTNRTKSDGNYSWYIKYGSTAKIAYETVHQNIIQ